MRRQQAKVLFEALEGRTFYDGTLSGLVHNDVNADHRVDEGSVAPATTVYVDRNDNGRLDAGERSTVTNASGRWVLRNVAPGTVQVRIIPPAGWEATNPAGHVGDLVKFLGDANAELPTFTIVYKGVPWSTVGQNAQHTGISPFRGGPLTQTPSEVTSTDPKFDDTWTKFGTPVFTRLNTVIVPIFKSGKGVAPDQYGVQAYTRFGGVLLWKFVSDYVQAPSVTLSNRTGAAIFQPAIGKDGRVYVPGVGGTVWAIGAPDRFVGGPDELRGAKQIAFYGMDNFAAKRGRYTSGVFINTPLTVSPRGDVYFGVETVGDNPQKVGPSLARVQINGRGSFVAAPVIAGSAPALSNDGEFIYVTTQADGRARIERFSAGRLSQRLTMTPAGTAVLTDPETEQRVTLTPGDVSLPVVAPDGDVYLATPARSAAVAGEGNGWLQRFSGDLKTVKGTQAQVMGDATPSIVPASMVEGYTGKSKYVVADVRITPVQETFTVEDPNQQDVDQALRTTHSFTTVLPNQRLSLFDPGTTLKRFGPEFLLTAVQGGTNSTTGNPIFGPALVASPVVVDPSGGSIYFVDAQERFQRWSVSDVKVVTAPLAIQVQTAEQTGGSPAVFGPDGQIYAATAGSLFAAF